MKKHRNYWWRSDESEDSFSSERGNRGQYNFCHDVDGNYEFYIKEVEIAFPGWTEEELAIRFGGAKYVWSGGSGKSTYSNVVLSSDNLNDAMREFEGWYLSYLRGKIEEGEIDSSEIDEYKKFLACRKHSC